MDIVHATWEMRNLGVDSYKMSVTDDDTWEDIVKEEQNIFGDYLVMKVPAHRSDISFHMNKLGYDFVHALIYCQYDNNRQFYLTPVQQRLINAVTCEQLGESDMDDLYLNISKGLFVNDTVAIDPHFSVELADKRHIGWISDSISRGAVMYGLKYRDKSIGFFGLEKISETIQSGLMGAIFPDYQRIGFGSLMLCFEITQAIKNGASKLYSSFASNNHGAFAIHMSMGFALDRVEYVFVKHNKKIT